MIAPKTVKITVLAVTKADIKMWSSEKKRQNMWEVRVHKLQILHLWSTQLFHCVKYIMSRISHIEEKNICYQDLYFLV